MTDTTRLTRKAKAIIEGMIEAKQVTPRGMDWLTLSTDPFHDVAVEPAGYPDVQTVNTLVQSFTFTTSISAPSTVGTGPWEAHVFLAPFTATIQSASATTLSPYSYNPLTSMIGAASVTAPQIQPGYNVITGPVGMDWLASASAVNATTALRYPANAVGGLYRLVACGVEVVNTTAELYKGGSVTYYRAPSHNMKIAPWVTNQGWFLDFETFDLPPTSQTLAQLYPTSRTLPAAEGYYGIGTLADEPQFLSAAPLTPFGWKPPSVANLTSGSGQVVYTYAPLIDSVATPQVSTTRVLPFDCHGCVFSGLLNQSTLQVTVRYYVERIPSTTEPDLLVLTRPPTPYDPVAVELYARVLARLPVGCTVKENPLGEWFDDVLSTVAEFAPKIGEVFGPLGKTLGTGIGAGAEHWLSTRKPQVLGQKQQKEAKVDRPANPQRRQRKRKPPASKPKVNNKQKQ